MPLADLDPRAAGPWDLAVIRVEWGALDPAQAMAELAAAAGLDGLSHRAVLAGGGQDWAAEVISQARVIPLLHLDRPLFARQGWEWGRSAGGLVDMGWTWRR